MRLTTQSIAQACFATLLVLFSFSAVAEVLVLAQLSDRPKKDYKQLRPMADYVVGQLSEFGFISAEVKLFKTTQELIAAVKSGEVHWVTETPYSAALLMYEADAVPIVEKWKSNQTSYKTVIYVHADSPVENLSQLKGLRIAFEHPQSFSSYFLPRIMLDNEGLRLNRIQRFNSNTKNSAVNYLFSRNEKNNALWVSKGLVEAGALNDGDWHNSKRVPPSLKRKLKIIATSQPYPRALELVSSKLALDVQEKLKKVLLSLDKESDGSLLKQYEKTAGFAPVTQSTYDALAEIYRHHQRWNQ